MNYFDDYIINCPQCSWGIFADESELDFRPAGRATLSCQDCGCEFEVFDLKVELVNYNTSITKKGTLWEED